MMRVILNDHVDHLGERGTTCDVKPGYARNYLIPKGLAYAASAANLARFKQEQRQWEREQQKEKQAAEAIAARLAGLELTFQRRAGEGDTLYGSVTTSDIADQLAARKIEVDRRRVVIPEHIKRIGTFTAEIHLHREVRVPVSIIVERAGD